MGIGSVFVVHVFPREAMSCINYILWVSNRGDEGFQVIFDERESGGFARGDGDASGISKIPNQDLPSCYSNFWVWSVFVSLVVVDVIMRSHFTWNCLSPTPSPSPSSSFLKSEAHLFLHILSKLKLQKLTRPSNP